MSKSDLVYLNHMLDAAYKVLEFTQGCTRHDLESDEMLSLAVVRLLEILGGAARHVTSEYRERNPQIPWRGIIGTRNRLIHGYFEVDLDIVWTIITADVPKLIPQLEALIASREES